LIHINACCTFVEEIVAATVAPDNDNDNDNGTNIKTNKESRGEDDDDDDSNSDDVAPSSPAAQYPCLMAYVAATRQVGFDARLRLLEQGFDVDQSVGADFAISLSTDRAHSQYARRSLAELESLLSDVEVG